MTKIQVIGYVGANALPDIQPDSQSGQQLLRALRDCVEEALEREYNAFAQLAISSDGTLEVVVKGEIEAELLASIQATALQCIEEFRENKLSSFLSKNERS